MDWYIVFPIIALLFLPTATKTYVHNVSFRRSCDVLKKMADLRFKRILSILLCCKDNTILVILAVFSDENCK